MNRGAAPRRRRGRFRAGGLALALLVAVLPGHILAQQTANASGGILRMLDKQTGAVADLTVPAGGGVEWGLLEVALGECRYPSGNPSGDAYAFLTIHYRDAADAVFRGWMIASSPALNALDHPRYDVWVLRCNTS